ncbi:MULTISPECIES: SDR family NAD(P)-dependent oxidoreductase [unclassified Phenylobacterium]|uniref:SDR family NAD(P)-dependent oxidoreductase n=1 Tax=unclassified Phenylobacterium TaxID=2640670 RepID=UPI00083A95CA|nr:MULTISPECIES: SDR family NAD(P)-dependent oxidoreductase [unclassified Phenylobacterium]
MPRVAVVTGANQGLGLALVERLCRDLEEGGHVYLTARDPAKGAGACAQLREKGLTPEFLQLDVTEPESVAACAEALNERRGGVDILISNAAARIGRDRPQADQVEDFIATNNLGTTRVLTAFEPLLRPGAHVVVVASSFGVLRQLPTRLHPRFDGPDLTLADIDRTMTGYVQAVRTGRAAMEGWPDWVNVPSKVGQVASMRIFARSLAGDGRGVVVNACCPGLVDTDASRPWFEDMSRAQSPLAAAEDVVWLVNTPTPESGPVGELVQHRRVLAWL